MFDFDIEFWRIYGLNKTIEDNKEQFPHINVEHGMLFKTTAPGVEMELEVF